MLLQVCYISDDWSHSWYRFWIYFYAHTRATVVGNSAEIAEIHRDFFDGRMELLPSMSLL